MTVEELMLALDKMPADAEVEKVNVSERLKVGDVVKRNTLKKGSFLKGCL